MDARSYTAVRDKFAETLDKVCDDHEPVFITRRNGKTVVMLSLEDYRSMEETAFLMRNPKNATRLLAAIEEIEAGRANIPWPELKRGSRVRKSSAGSTRKKK